MDESEVLRKLAQDKIVAESGQPLDAVGEAAATLLADLYVVSLQHGISPDDWAAVTALPGACWDAARALARRTQLMNDRAARLSEGWPLLRRATEPVRGPDQPGRGRAMRSIGSTFLEGETSRPPPEVNPIE